MQTPFDVTAPTTPASLTANAQSATQIQLNWQPSTDADSSIGGYRIYRNGSTTPITTVTTNSYVDTGLAPSTSYTYSIRAFDAASPPNESGFSASISVTTLAGPAPPATDTTPPTTPTGLVASAQSTRQIQISWQPATDVGAGVAGYRIFRDGSATAIATVTGTAYVDSGLAANTTYSYVVRAFDAAVPSNESAASASISAATMADTAPPTVPTGLTAVAQSASAILLSWQGSTDADSAVAGYRIYRSDSATPIGRSHTTTFLDAGLVSGTTYSYTVRAIDTVVPANESAASNVATATTQTVVIPPDTTAPTVPSNVVATALSGTEIRVTWQASTDTGAGVAGYRVFRNGNSVPIANVTATSFADTVLTPGTSYTYTVRAFDAASPANLSAESAPATATTTADTTAPTVPTALTAVVQSASQIQLSWQASTDTGTGVAGYRIYRNGASVAVATVTGTGYLDTGLTPSTSYSYTVRAFDNAAPANVSAESAAASATTSADTTAPIIPTGLAAVAQSATQIQLSWQPSTDTGTGVAGYRVYRNGGATPIATTSSTSFLDTGRTPATSYTYTVRAFDGATPPNVSADSSSASATTLADTAPPTVPAGLTATTQSASEIQLNWQPATDTDSGVAGYRVYRNGGTTPITTVTGTSYLDSGLVASTTYSYTVRAVDTANPANVSADSASASATTSAASAVYGLDTRPSNASCLAGAAPSTDVSIAVERVFPNLDPATNEFDVILGLLQEPSSSARWYVVSRKGKVKVFDNQPNVASSRLFFDATSIINSAGDEQGLLGMAFHPNYPTNPRVYLSYTATVAGAAVSRVTEFQTTDGGLTLNPSTAQVVLQTYQPESNHNGGHILFGPDGYLYFGLGDGGSGGDPHGSIGNGQRLSTLLGKLLRIDVNNAAGGNRYAIPADNPYAGNASCNNDTGAFTQNCPEIYAYGLRNPWRFSFDRGTGKLWLGDVGQNSYEEIDVIVKGGNYGWRCFEGAHAYNSNCGSNAGSSILPYAEYGRTTGFSVTGGFVYRGSAIPNLVGRYVFGDFGSQNLWHIPTDASSVITVSGGLGTGHYLSSFAQDLGGELYVLSYYRGEIYKIVAGAGSSTVPAQLSATGCVASGDATQAAAGLIPYAPNAPFWSDGALKARYLAMPDGQRLTINADGDFDFPNGSVLMKNFRLGGQLVETRLFMRHSNGQWAGYTYEWNAQGTDATRVIGGKTVQVAGQDWMFPSEAQCLQCHTTTAGSTLGLEVSQLNGLFNYAATGRTANQLETLNHINMLTPQLSQPVSQLGSMPDPYGLAGTLGERARAYLHTNCSNCHRPGTGVPGNMDLRYTTPLPSTGACEVVPMQSLGISNARLIAVGDAARSLLVNRPGRTDSNAMPPMLPRRVDTAGVALLTNWVNSLVSCN